MANTLRVEVTETIDAPPAQVYDILANYRTSHPAILPKAFKSLTVQQGGYGEGTVFLTDMEVMGVKRSYHMTVTEPQPGRVLAEEDAQVGTYTEFIVQPVGDGQQTHLTISTTSHVAEGFGGVMERIINPPVMRRIFKREMANINVYARQHRTAAATA
jgi:hypothetical protein